MTLLEELKQGKFKYDRHASYPHLFADFYTTDSGTKIIVKFTLTGTIVEINNVETTKFYGWRIRRAIKKGGKYVKHNSV